MVFFDSSFRCSSLGEILILGVYQTFITVVFVQRCSVYLWNSSVDFRTRQTTCDWSTFVNFLSKSERSKNVLMFLLFDFHLRFQLTKSNVNDDDDEEEHFHDVLSDEDEQTPQQVPQVSSWDHKTLNKSKENHTYQYDLYKRNPLFCGADYTCLHELVFLRNHSHPTVALFAENLLHGKSIEYEGNPLVDFNSMRFFDRFIYKNPKKQIAKHGKSMVFFSSFSDQIFVSIRKTSTKISSCCWSIVFAERSESSGRRQYRIHEIESGKHSG